jgi:hypothetical protein
MELAIKSQPRWLACKFLPLGSLDWCASICPLVDWLASISYSLILFYKYIFPLLPCTIFFNIIKPHSRWLASCFPVKSDCCSQIESMRIAFQSEIYASCDVAKQSFAYTWGLI